MTDTDRSQLGARLEARPHGGLPEVRANVEHLAWLHPREHWSIAEWERWWLLKLVDRQAREIARLRKLCGEGEAVAVEVPERVAGTIIGGSGS